MSRKLWEFLCFPSVAAQSDTANTQYKYNLATPHFLGYIVSFELTQYDIRNTEYEL